jgi:hypothetical protein
MHRRERAVKRALAIAVPALFMAQVARAEVAPEQQPRAVDYEAGFARSFPLIAGGHRVLDWKVYTALVDGDVVTYAARIDPVVAKGLERTKGKPFQTQQLEEDVRGDQRLRLAFDEQRRRIRTMVLHTDGDGLGADACRHPLVYVAGEFRLVLGENPGRGDPLANATVAPSCPQTLEAGFQITAGRSRRFACWTAGSVTTCAWRLPDMPLDLKRVIESEYPSSIKARWRWRGLGSVIRVRGLDFNGNRVAERDRVALTVPLELGLEFVDGAGRVRWTAASTGWAAAASPRERQ